MDQGTRSAVLSTFVSVASISASVHQCVGASRMHRAPDRCVLWEGNALDGCLAPADVIGFIGRTCVKLATERSPRCLQASLGLVLTTQILWWLRSC